MKKSLLALVALLFLAPSEAPAQLFSSTPSFLETRLLPRAHALGSATVALPRGYAGTGQVNPATIGRAGFVQAMNYVQDGGSPLLTTPWPLVDKSELWVTEPAVSYKRGRWAGAYQYRRFNFGEHECRDKNNVLCGTFTSYNASHQLTVAYDASESFSVGAGLEYVRSKLAPSRENLEIHPATSLALNLGVHYEHSPLAVGAFQVTPSAGWALRHFGGTMSYLEEDSLGNGDPLPITTQAGLSLEARTNVEAFGRPALRVGLHGNLSKMLVGFDGGINGDEITPRTADGPFETLIAGWEPFRIDRNPTDDDPGERIGTWEQINKHAGLEVFALDVFALRLGRVWRHEVNGGSQQTVGFGLNLYYVALDHSAVMSAENNGWSDASFWTLTARVPLGDAAHAENLWPELIEALGE